MIRPATASDEPAVRACAEAAYARYVAAIGRKPAPMAADFGSLIAAGHVHVHVDADGALDGYIVFYRDGDAMHLENVAVRPTAAGRGLGKALIAFCENETRRMGLAAVALYTNEKMTENLSIYPHLGYEEIGRREEAGFKRVYFRKPLD